MKHHVSALMLFVGFMLHAGSDTYVISDKSKRIGRFSYEDAFNENLVEKVLKNAPSIIKKNINRLLYPEPEEEDIKQQLLLLGGISNVATTAIAKAIALRCGYEYYVIEASALLQKYREGQQALLTEVRSVIKQGKPIAIIITELPEIADYSGLLASTLWMLIDQCKKYPDVLVIATSALPQDELSGTVKEHFGRDIIPVALDKKLENEIENKVGNKNWVERHRSGLTTLAGVAGCSLVASYAITQILISITQLQMKKENLVLKKRMVELQDDFLLVQKQQKSFNEEDFNEKKRLQQELQKSQTINSMGFGGALSYIAVNIARTIFNIA